MTRGAFIERIIIQYYGGLPEDDSDLTHDILNSYLPDALGAAAKQCYAESIKVDGVAYVNNSFYSTFSGLQVLPDDTDNMCYKIELPEIPVGIGRNEGVSELRFKAENEFVSRSAIPVDIAQWGYMDNMRQIPNKIFYLPEGKYIRIKTTLILTEYNGIVKMISGGDGNDLDSELNVPPDYLPIMSKYILEQLSIQKRNKPDVASDGVDMA